MRVYIDDGWTERTQEAQSLLDASRFWQDKDTWYSNELYARYCQLRDAA